MRVLYAALTLIIAVATADFAVSNRMPITLGIWPAPSQLVCPLYLIVLPTLVGGFLIGRIFGWIANARLRGERRRQTRKIANLEAELRQAAPRAAAPPPGGSLTEQQQATLLMSAH